MDFMSMVGWILGAFLIIFGIAFNGSEGFVFANIWNFVDVSSIAITIGGTLAALMISFPIRIFPKTIKHLKIIFFPSQYNPHIYIEKIVEFAKEARMKGLLSLEDKLNETEDVFLRNSLMLVVDSVEPEKVKQRLDMELDYLDERHRQDRGFYEKGAIYAPAFGMIGTLIGLINMLQNMEDAKSIGPAMSVALVTTFYGTILANLIFSPIANKLKVRHDEEILCKTIICEGVQAIQAGENPKFVGEKLTLLLSNSNRKNGKDRADANTKQTAERKQSD